jgi:hypothetical protein
MHEPHRHRIACRFNRRIVISELRRVIEQINQCTSGFTDATPHALCAVLRYARDIVSALPLRQREFSLHARFIPVSFSPQARGLVLASAQPGERLCLSRARAQPRTRRCQRRR